MSSLTHPLAPSPGSPSASPNTVVAPIPESLRELVGYLDSLTARADLRILAGMLKNLRTTRSDLDPWCQFGTRGYRRNTIKRSRWYELLALCWRSGDCTPIHDHAGCSCAFRVMNGLGTEIRYRVTDSGLVCPVGVVEMSPGYICAAEDADIHQVANTQPPGKELVTMHIYSPPIELMTTYTPMGVRNRVAWDDDPRGHEPMI